VPRIEPLGVDSWQREVYWNDSPGARTADHARSLHFLGPAVAMGDDPVAAEELHRLVPFIGDPDGVVEEPLAVEGQRVGNRALRNVLGFDFYANVVGDRL
jgi:hypothetical protein